MMPSIFVDDNKNVKRLGIPGVSHSTPVILGSKVATQADKLKELAGISASPW